MIYTPDMIATTATCTMPITHRHHYGCPEPTPIATITITPPEFSSDYVIGMRRRRDKQKRKAARLPWRR